MALRTGRKIEEGVYRTSIHNRHARGNRMRLFYMSSIIIAFLALLALAYNIINSAIGLVAVDFEVKPSEINPDGEIAELSSEQLANVLVERASGQLLRLVYENLSDLPDVRDMSGVPLNEALRDGVTIPEGLETQAINDLNNEQRGELLGLNLSSDELADIINEVIIKERILESWKLSESLLERDEINQRVEDAYLTDSPDVVVRWRSWLSLDFITGAISSTTPGITGIRPALIGTVWLLILTAAIAFPLGVGAAIYLEEYANHAWYNRLIEVNIRNLAGVPSIIYGMLGLAIFVRALEDLTSGSAFGAGSANGRTILSAALTLALLILPIIIAGTQEALRAVPSAIREASYGLGATKWQTISRQIIPTALPGILTATIIALSRAIGETAPLIVVGAATFLTTDPSGPFSQFSALPIMIFHWTSQPDQQFQNTAAAAIIMLLIVLLTMNSTAIVLRNRASKGI